MLKSPKNKNNLEDVQNQFAVLSLTGTTTVEIANHILDQVLAYVAENDAFLKTEGIYRLAGNEADMKNCFEQLKKNPHSVILKNVPAFIKEPNNLTGILRKSLLEARIEWSQDALAILIKFQKTFHISSTNKDEVDNLSTDEISEEYNPTKISELIKALTTCGTIAEAKLFHNVIHFCYLICQHQKTNKMTPKNMAILITPSLSAMTKHQFPVDLNLKMLKLIEDIPESLINIAPQVYHTMLVAISSKEHFGLCFEESYPIAAQLLKDKINASHQKEKFSISDPKRNKTEVLRKREAYRKSISLRNPDTDHGAKEGYYPSNKFKRSPSWHKITPPLQIPTIVIPEEQEEHHESLSASKKSSALRIRLRKSKKE